MKVQQRPPQPTQYEAHHLSPTLPMPEWLKAEIRSGRVKCISMPDLGVVLQLGPSGNHQAISGDYLVKDPHHGVTSYSPADFVKFFEQVPE